MSDSLLPKLTPIWPLAMISLVLVLTIIPSAQMLLRLDDNYTLADQWWRLITAHWVHLGWQHSLLNILGLLLVWFLSPRGSWLYWWAFYLCCSLLISGVLLYQTEIRNYVGASGVLHGLLILAAYFSPVLTRLRRYLFIGIIILKLLWEQTPWYSGDGLGSVIGGFVVTDAHFWGGITACLVLCAIEIKKRWGTSNNIL